MNKKERYESRIALLFLAVNDTEVGNKGRLNEWVGEWILPQNCLSFACKIASHVLSSSLSSSLQNQVSLLSNGYLFSLLFPVYYCLSLTLFISLWQRRAKTEWNALCREPWSNCLLFLHTFIHREWDKRSSIETVFFEVKDRQNESFKAILFFRATHITQSYVKQRERYTSGSRKRWKDGEKEREDRKMKKTEEETELDSKRDKKRRDWKGIQLESSSSRQRNQEEKEVRAASTSNIPSTSLFLLCLSFLCQLDSSMSLT